MAVRTGTTMGHAQLERFAAEGKLDEGFLAGELVIRGAPLIRHERAVNVLMGHVRAWVRGHGGEAFTGIDVEIGAHQLVPELAFVGPERAGELDADGFHVPPDLVIEVTSPGTRSLDLVEKRAVYEAIGVGEYWVVDLAEQRVIVHRRDAQGAYQAAEHAEGTLSTEQASGLEVPVGAVLAA